MPAGLAIRRFANHKAVYWYSPTGGHQDGHRLDCDSARNRGVRRSAAKATLSELRPLFAQALPAIIENFCRYVAKHEPGIAALRDPQFIQESIRLHLAHWQLIAAANFGDELSKSALQNLSPSPEGRPAAALVHGRRG